MVNLLCLCGDDDVIEMPVAEEPSSTDGTLDDLDTFDPGDGSLYQHYSARWTRYGDKVALVGTNTFRQTVRYILEWFRYLNPISFLFSYTKRTTCRCVPQFLTNHPRKESHSGDTTIIFDSIVIVHTIYGRVANSRVSKLLALGSLYTTYVTCTKM